MATFIKAIMALLFVFFAGYLVYSFFSGSKYQEESSEYYFADHLGSMTIENFEYSTGTDGGKDVFYQFTASEETIEGLLETLDLRGKIEGIDSTTVKKNLFTLPSWFAPDMSEEIVFSQYPSYYGVILVISSRMVPDPENEDQEIEEAVYYFGAAGTHLGEE